MSSSLSLPLYLDRTLGPRGVALKRASKAESIRDIMEVGADGVMLVTLCNPPVNALHPIIIQGLKEKYAEAMDCDEVKAIVLTDAGGKFCGGFDISVFTEAHKTG